MSDHRRPVLDPDAILATSLERAREFLDRELYPSEIDVIRGAVRRFIDSPTAPSTRLQ